ncbi:hypothetical protein L202_06429 [Cryptococcus amylolentus CBS 6039]|uniref:Exoribonuclease phosphorolytic domain-containing protein n=2 Tax=Cryptococcus amylolentus TaxID=104669 RepID=A0A1E3HFY6_9TREE|nr:hypothetical protein L202_06429 [Cryptococcus amylolentus CBS 6039]ODN75237.1 hypothetical protein L202_06429 [Cryptococcus amylolentus CBS 6039]ODO03013.1 hypothetical protein I350_05857 [Cryptococcus amylolentus CBS 6273]
MSRSTRPDGRSPSQLRPVHISINELDRADGSGRFAFGSDAILASTSGPIEVRLRDENPTQATLEITHRPLSGTGATPSRALTTTLERIFSSTSVLELEKFPRSLVQIVVQGLTAPSVVGGAAGGFGSIVATEEGKGKGVWPREDVEQDYIPASVLEERKVSPLSANSYTFASRAASLNATTLSILSAGSVPIKSLPIGVAVALGTKGEFWMDPEAAEERRARARFGFGWAWGKGIGEQGAELVWVESEGEFSRKEWQQALQSSKAASKQILDTIKLELANNIPSGVSL